MDEKQLHELHITAKPLIETCSPIVVQQINESVRVAEIGWKDTNNNLHNLRDKYDRALNLWKNYRDSSDAIKNWAAHRMSTINVLKPLDANDIEVNFFSLIYKFCCSHGFFYQISFYSMNISLCLAESTTMLMCQ